jgi:hypothetical protein
MYRPDHELTLVRDIKTCIKFIKKGTAILRLRYRYGKDLVIQPYSLGTPATSSGVPVIHSKMHIQQLIIY